MHLEAFDFGAGQTTATISTSQLDLRDLQGTVSARDLQGNLCSLMMFS